MRAAAGPSQIGPPDAGPLPDETARAETARAELARRQAELLAALLGQAPAPRGFDRHRVGVEADALRAKRRRVLARLVDDEVVDALGPRLEEHLDHWVREHPRRTGTGFHDDADAFTSSLRRDGLLRRRRRARWPWSSRARSGRT